MYVTRCGEVDWNVGAADKRCAAGEECGGQAAMGRLVLVSCDSVVRVDVMLLSECVGF